MFNLIRLKNMLDNVIKSVNELSDQQQVKIAEKEEFEKKLRVQKIAVLRENGLRLAANQPHNAVKSPPRKMDTSMSRYWQGVSLK